MENMLNSTDINSALTTFKPSTVYMDLFLLNLLQAQTLGRRA